MFKKLAEIWRIKELRKRIIFSLVLLGIFRLAAHIPLPAVNQENLRSFFENNQIFGLLNMFSGSGMENMSIVLLGVGPYITSTIILQLLTMIIPKLQQMMKEEGEAGRKKFNQITRIVTIPLAALQGYTMITLLSRQSPPIITDLSVYNIILTIIIATAGTMFLMWIGELITEKGIGNGVSLIIFAGIITNIPQAVQQAIVSYDPTQLFNYLVFAVIGVVVIAGVVIVTEGQRNIPVSYAKRIKGNRMYGGGSTHLPMRVNQGGVIPIIFALSLMIFPGLIANFLSNSDITWLATSAKYISDLFNNQVFYGVVYFILVIAFTYFYTAISFDPHSISDNLQKQGGFIPGIRPGQSTESYLKKTLNRVTLAGAIFLGMIAVMPFLVQGLTSVQSMVIGGTGLLIVVSVVIETVKQVEAQMVMRDYESFY
ncbi:MAG: preprotein translocase subunit SecY [bacterium]